MTKRKPLFIFARAAMTLLVMLLTTATAWAQDPDPVASVTIGETTESYPTLPDAISAAIAAYVPASGDNPATIPTVTLLQDISSENFGICNGYDEVAVILDLNSKTISGGDFINIDELATLTITDNSTSKIGKIFNDFDYCIVNDGVLIIEGGEISGGTEYTISNNGTLTLNDGFINPTSDGIINYGTLTITGGTITSVGDSEYPSTAILNYNVLTVSGGKIIDSGNGIKNVVHNSGYWPNPKFTMTALPTFSGNDVDIYLDKLPISFTETISTAPTSLIKVKTENVSPVFTEGYNTFCTGIHPARIFVSVDNSLEVAAYIENPDDSGDDGLAGEAQLIQTSSYAVSVIYGNEITNYGSLSQAMNYANGKQGAIVRMNRNRILIEDDYINVEKGTAENPIMLDLNGRLLSGSYDYVISVQSGNALTIIDGNGSIVNTKAISGEAIKNIGTLTINGGDFSANGEENSYDLPGKAILNYGTLLVNGGNFVNSKIGICHSTFSGNASFNITALPTFRNNDIDIYFSDSFITFTEDISSAPTTPIKVDVDSYCFTINYSTHCSNIPPSRMFQRIGNYITILDNGEVKGIDGYRLIDDGDNSSTINNHYNQGLNSQNNKNYQLFGRTLYRNGDWNTLCLPFSMTESQIANSSLSGATIKELNADESSLAANGVMTLTFKNATADSQDGNNIIKAGKPYIIRWNASDNLANIIDPVFTGVNISVTEPTAVEFASNCKFVGQYSPFLISDGSNNTVNNIKEILMMGSGSTVGYSNTPRELKCFRAHFEIPEASEARSFQINFDNEDLTGIVNIERQSLDVKRSAGTWYSLDGRKLSTEPLQKGVYIHNGKKIIIK